MDSPSPDAKPCTVCGESKPATREHFNVTRGKYLEHVCRVCRRARYAVWLAENSEIRSASNATYYAKMHTGVQLLAVEPESVEQRLLVSVAELERWLDRARRSAWSYHHRQRARTRGSVYTAVDRREVWQRSAGTCHLCTLPITDGERWTVDHIIPVSLGGPHIIDNLAVAHNRCNARKRNALTITAETIERYSDIIAASVRAGESAA